MLDFDEHYRSMTDDELLNVARDSRDLTPEARNSLNGELSRRKISGGQISNYEHEQANDNGDKKFNLESVFSLWPALGRVRDSIRDWKQYRHQTGEWPRRSIAFYFLHLFVEIAVLLLFIWYSSEHRWSTGAVIVILILLVIVDVALSNWFQKRIRLAELNHYRHARGS